MDTTRVFESGRRTQACVIRGTALAAALFAALLTAQAGVAQEAALPSKLAAAPLPAARGAVPMLVSMAAMPAGAAVAAAAAEGIAPLRGPNCTGAMHDESNVLVPVGKSALVPLAEPTRNRTLGNPGVVQATLVSPRTLYVVGMSVGTTNMIVQGKSGACQMINVVVNIDPSGLQQSLAQLMPEERGIRVATAAGNLVLAGRVSSAAAAQQAMHIAQAFAGAQPTQQSQSATSSSGGGAFTASQQMSSTSKPSEVINMMTIDSPQQVMLEVKVAEVSKTLMNQMGSALNIQGGFGSWTGAVVSDLLAGVSSAFVANKANNRPFRVALDAQNTDQPVKILAEPNLVTISGQEATFLAGGKIFIPVPQSSSTGATTITLQAEEFGVALKFTPTVLSSGRINLKVAPEVSELSSTGVTLSATNVSGVSILPLITTRRASTTVQMGDGETFAIGGLIKDNVSGTLKALPGVGEVPVLGALFRSTAFQQDRTELVFIITPHLVKPLQTSNVPLPTDSFNKPNEADVYATGVMEGRGGARKLHGMPTAPNTQPPVSAPQTPPQQPQPGNAGDTAPGPVSRNDTAASAQASAQTSAQTSAQQAAPEANPPAAAPAATTAPATPSDTRTDVQVSRIENEAARIATREAGTPDQPADH